MFVPLAHPPGHAQADFGEATVIIGGVEQKAHFFVLDLPHSDACFVRAYPAATAEAWVDGHVHAFAFFGKVPVSVLYDNDRCLVSRILPDGTRQRATLFSGFLSHYLFRDRYGRPGKGNDKGKVEGLVGYSRRNFMVPIPRFATWDAFNAHLEEQCHKRQGDVLRGQSETIGERLTRDLAAMSELPAAPFEACDQATGRVSSQALVRYKTNDYSVPVAYGHRDVWIRGYVEAVVIGCGG
jgi:transposase